MDKGVYLIVVKVNVDGVLKESVVLVEGYHYSDNLFVHRSYNSNNKNNWVMTCKHTGRVLCTSNSSRNNLIKIYEDIYQETYRKFITEKRQMYISLKGVYDDLVIKYKGGCL